MFQWANRRPIGAHRASYMLSVGEIQGGLFVCHHCDNPACVRPDHLFLGTNADNMRDAYAKGRVRMPQNVGFMKWTREQRSAAAMGRTKTHCKRGHELTAGNLYWSSGRGGRPTRHCRACALTVRQRQKEQL